MYHEIRSVSRSEKWVSHCVRKSSKISLFGLHDWKIWWFCITMTLFITIEKKKTLADTSFGWWWVLVLNDDDFFLFWLLAHWVDCFLCFSSLAQTSSRSSDSLARLYEMDDHPDRRVFLDKLLSFMEEKGTPITQCPTISKNPLDLFRLYLYTKERGGYLEVSKSAIVRFRPPFKKTHILFITFLVDTVCWLVCCLFVSSAQNRKRGRTLRLN